ncbi:MAG: flagellar biosynthesis protein FlhA [Pseudomonadota bacterium]
MADTANITPAGQDGQNSQTGSAGSFASFLPLRFFNRAFAHIGLVRELTLALGILMLIVVLIFPTPKGVLDFALALSIMFSVLILMVTLFIGKPLEFSSFPTVLLLATLMRLALNLASTRLILSNGHEGTDAAGKVIEAFGGFIMGGNYVIGIIVFSILVVVNFVVITKGSGRIAEVSARFSLDSMPGKQMAVDADLSAGLINEEQAKERRKTLEDESNFFGAMDGAAKFVRGDAIAGLIITLINIIGGIVIGVAQKDMTFAQAGEAYTLLTVGDGLVTQVPALIVSVAAGLLVSKAGLDVTANEAVLGQISNYPKAMLISSGVMIVLSALPGIPMVPFVLMAATTGGLGFILSRSMITRAAEESAAAETEEMADAVPAEAPIADSLRIDTIRLELGYGLLGMVDAEQASGRRVTDQLRGLRAQLATEYGFVMPKVRVQDDLQLGPTKYAIRIKEIKVAEGDVRPNMLLAILPTGRDDVGIPGEQTQEPAFGLPALWIEEKDRNAAAAAGCTVVDPATVIVTHFTELLRDNMSELLSYSATQDLLDEQESVIQKLISDLMPRSITVGGVQRILQNLLTERVSIRDMPTILEGISEATAQTQNLMVVTEHVRARLARQINASVMDSLGSIPVITLSSAWETEISQSIVGEGENQQLALAPTRLRELMDAVQSKIVAHTTSERRPVILTTATTRSYIRSIVERVQPATTVLSQNEIHRTAKIDVLDQI